MDFDFKITTWERIHVPEDCEGELLRLIKDGTIKSGNDAIEHFPDGRCEKLTDCDEQMTVDNNDGFATIIVQEDGEEYFANGKH